VIALLFAGCNRQDTEALTRIGKKVQHRTEVLTGAIKTNAASSWHAVGDPGIEVRVAVRLRWDAELTGAAIEVHMQGNVIQLRGTVQSLEQRRRAIMVAETTLGVESVTDELTNGPDR
jgi:osmotically-inducible protein OsmY